MKKTSAILAAAVAGASLASAQELSITTTVAWESEYIFRGVQLAEEYFAPSIDLKYGDFYAGIWSALPVDSTWRNGQKLANEVDYYAGYSPAIDDKISLDFGFTYYTYPNLSDKFFDSDVNTFEIFAGVNFEVPMSPALYAFYDFDTKAFTLEASGGYSWEIDENSTVDLSLHLGWVDPDDIDSYFYYGAGVAYNYAFTDKASVKLFVNWYGCEEDFMGSKTVDNSNKISYGVSFTAGF